MSATPRVSIVMPCLNMAEHIGRAIDSVRAQSFADLELLVVDNGSTDDTVARVEAVGDPRIRLLHEAEPGPSAARNHGIAAARGEYLSFLDADDTWAGDALEALHGALQAHPGAVLAYGGWQNLGHSQLSNAPFIPPDYEGPDKLERLMQNCRWPIHAILTRTASVREAGGFDPRLRRSEDFLLWLRLCALRPIVRVPQLVAFYHFERDASLTTDKAEGAFEHLRAQHIFLDENPWVARRLGRRTLRRITLGEMLRRAYLAYWGRRLEVARPLFRRVMRSGYGRPRDWLYMLPALLPAALHRGLIGRLSRG